MTLRAILAIIRRDWIVVVAVLLSCIAGGAAIALVLPDRFETSTQILFQPAAADPGADSAPAAAAEPAELLQNQLPTYAALATTASVLDPVAERLSTDSSRLKDQVSASIVPDTAIVTLTTTAATARGAAELANLVGASLIERAAALDPTGTGSMDVRGNVVEAPVVPTSAGAGPITSAVVGLLVGLVLAWLVLVARQALRAPAREERRERVGDPAAQPDGSALAAIDAGSRTDVLTSGVPAGLVVRTGDA